jgi:hypothetical protein
VDKIEILPHKLAELIARDFTRSAIGLQELARFGITYKHGVRDALEQTAVLLLQRLDLAQVAQPD